MSRTLASLLVLLTALASCDVGVIRSSNRESSQPAPAMISPAARAYLDALLAIMEAHSINKNTIDWAAFRAKVFAAAAGAQVIPDTYPAIVVALKLLRDQHSNYLTSAGKPITRSGKGCAAATPAPPPIPTLPATIGYVRVPPFGGGGTAAKQFAESLQRDIRAADNPALTGWIVDLRGNYGGNLWPMIAGVSPILGDGILGYSIFPDAREEVWEYSAGAFHLEGATYRYVDTQYALLKEQPRVAVLTDRAVVSSGEGVAIAFRGRPGTRSFGTPTCGLSTGNTDFPLSDGAVLVLTETVMADRTKTKYGNSIPPDEIIPDPQEAVSRASAWLQDGR